MPSDGIKMKTATLFLVLFLFSAYAYSDGRKELWSEGKEAVAVCEMGEPNSCYVVIGATKVDISQVENANIGKLGLRPKSAYDKVISFPSLWVKVRKPAYMVQVTTQAWFEGRRYTVSGPAYIKHGIYVPR